MRDSTSGSSTIDCFEMSGSVAVVDTRATSNSGFKCNGEVREDGEGDLVSEWYSNLDSLAIHSSGPPSSAKYVEAPKIGSTTRGIPTQSRPWLAAPYPFGIASPTGDNGTSFPIYECVCIEFYVSNLTGPLYDILILTLI